MKSSVKETASSPVAYQDLRQWLQGVTELGELKTIRNCIGIVQARSYWLNTSPVKSRREGRQNFAAKIRYMEVAVEEASGQRAIFRDYFQARRYACFIAEVESFLQ